MSVISESVTRVRAIGSVAPAAELGLILGGVLTEYLSWRWCLYVNAPIAVVVAIGGAAMLGAAVLSSAILTKAGTPEASR